MIHFTCDGCDRRIDAESEVRYVLNLEVYASLDDTNENPADERDHLEELEEILDRIDDVSDDAATSFGSEVYEQNRYDLCPDCRKRLSQNPLSRVLSPGLTFSKN